jgi:hypothetical protein
VVVVGAAVAIPLLLIQCKSETGDNPNNPIIPDIPTEVGIEITNANISDAIVAGQAIHYTENDTMTFGHKMLDLKVLSDADPEHRTLFTIDGLVNFGLLIDPDMNCHINGINNASVNCATSLNLNACGVFVGRNNGNMGQNWNYRGNLQIDDNVSFSVQTNSHDARGI